MDTTATDSLDTGDTREMNENALHTNQTGSSLHGFIYLCIVGSFHNVLCLGKSS